MSTRTNPRYTGTLQIIAMPEAEIIASGRILTPDECWVPTDGANMGKHAGGNGVDIYQNLVFWEDGGGGGSSDWGDIGGTLSDQTDLQTVLNTKVESITLPNTYGTFGNAGGTATNPSFPLQSEAQMRTIAQIGHGFTAPQALKVEAGGGGVNALAQGDDAGNSSFVGFVFEVASANQYRLITSGYANIFTGLTAGSYYYLSPSTPGAITATPNAFGPVLKAVSTTGGYVLSNSAFIDTPALRRASLGLPNVYTAILNQTGAAAPVATFVTNQLGGTPGYIQAGTGSYILGITGAFPAGTKVHATIGRNGQGTVNAYRMDDDQVAIETYDTAFATADSILGDTSLRIEVWP